MIEKIMSQMMGKENMPRMMETMMGEIFSDMGLEDKMNFMGQMMPMCISKIFENIEKEDRAKTAHVILEKLKEELEKRTE
ncbi:hypothetical protein IPdc08_01455 [archaeon]|nr:hypothetical protein IPdc08_01455 [archaeon]